MHICYIGIYIDSFIQACIHKLLAYFGSKPRLLSALGFHRAFVYRVMVPRLYIGLI